jgi:nitrogenase-associated protein
MADVIFYEKPGCINNTKQKKLLTEAGYDVDARNLLTELWTKESLLEFFKSMPTNTWFNLSAPAIKAGAVNPDMLTADQAINCMIADPLLIRRPLIQVGDVKLVGFEPHKLAEVFTELNLHNRSIQHEDLESCPKRDTSTVCNVIE